MPKPIPPDQHCPDCGKPIGTPDTRGYFGAECFCGKDIPPAAGRGHSIQANPPKF